ncbi:hypothetical protein ACX0G7_07845 [Flavitalea antarctica]
MMNLSNLQLSAEESAMVQNSHWLLTKNIIMQKAYLLFGEAASGLQAMLAAGNGWQEDLSTPSPKIARGENYKGLPYVMLDYPRHFGKDNIFAFRTMFWWGNFLSFTWHLKGTYAARYRRGIIQHHQRLSEAGFHICINEDEWQHDFDPDNYYPIPDLSTEALEMLLDSKSFTKLAIKIPLDQWNNANEALMKNYLLILELVKISSQDGERDPLPGNPKAGFDL